MSHPLFCDRRGLLRLIGAGAALAAVPAFAADKPASPTPVPAPAKARVYPDLIGEVTTYTIKEDDTLFDLAVEFRVGFVELAAANQGVEVWVPEVGSSITVPTAHILPDASREGLVVNLGDMRVYYFPADGTPIDSSAIGVGAEGALTPMGKAKILRKQAKPTWYPPASIRKEKPELPAVVKPGPDNPLGDYAMYLSWPSYLIHGTNLPPGVGRRTSHGCIRMYPADIERLFHRVPVGAPVTVVNQPIKFGWRAGDLYMEAHPNLKQSDELEDEGKFTPDRGGDIEALAKKAAGKLADQIDWKIVGDVVEHRSGLPVRIIKAA
jgi:L,D-transpeptidase ErfK/SrfK